MTTAPPPRPALDQDLRALLAVICDQDRGESPFGWSTLTPPEPTTNGTPLL